MLFNVGKLIVSNQFTTVRMCGSPLATIHSHVKPGGSPAPSVPSSSHISYLIVTSYNISKLSLPTSIIVCVCRKETDNTTVTDKPSQQYQLAGICYFCTVPSQLLVSANLSYRSVTWLRLERL